MATAEQLPVGFRRSVETGLILPEPVSRQRQVWTRDEWRLLERATKMLKRQSIKVMLECEHDTCKGVKMEGARRRDGSFVLTCAHAERVLQKEF